ncbi:MAG: hypothetical protein M0037_05610 [Betaproteobacteria bacterium]|nr:hypothetical protein [Betaproteobacteria bacterium]
MKRLLSVVLAGSISLATAGAYAGMMKHEGMAMTHTAMQKNGMAHARMTRPLKKHMMKKHEMRMGTMKQSAMRRGAMAK